ncbi:hypothetical protein [Comamonas sp. GB3 AK4-5]|uniref:hypothetical protein n=1 Tax=Comamonas sp. GB3 AK4-5 TaxID=3231487 RepID=UPI00351EB33C
MPAFRPPFESLQLFPQRVPCPPGACDCGHATLVQSPGDHRILLLTREEEAKLVQRLEQAQSLPELRQLQQRMQEQLGLQLVMAPGKQGTQGLRGLDIHLLPLPGLCRKTRKALPAAVRRCMEQHPEIAHALLDEGSLFADL